MDKDNSILVCYGTRPEYIKVKGFLKYRKELNLKLLYVAQHENLINGEFDYKISINEGNNRLDSIISSVLIHMDDIMDGVTHVMVQGDTATAFAVALAALNRNKKIIHLEAGLRTYDKNNPYPEESYRQMISRIADIHFCPTEGNKMDLVSEKSGGEIFVVGNTGLDGLFGTKTRSYNKVLVTIHRRENHEIAEKWFKEIENLAATNTEYEFIIPIHPNPNIKKHSDIFKRVKIVDPMSHKDIIDYMKDCKVIITDSGGIQEEGSFLGKRVIVCRKTTERPEAIGKGSYLCKSPELLKQIFNNAIKNYSDIYECPYGDGKSSERIIKILEKCL